MFAGELNEFDWGDVMDARSNLHHFSDLKSAPIAGYFDRACEALLALKRSQIDLSSCEMRYADDAFVFRWDFVVLHILAEPGPTPVFYIVQTFTPPSIAFFGTIADAISVLKVKECICLGHSLLPH